MISIKPDQIALLNSLMVRVFSVEEVDLSELFVHPACVVLMFEKKF